ncbi:amino acid transporter AVT6E-like [Nymphaea colorata]|uniref:Amino acid transporter transmembrane domain-containing protein n=1 Tax=Nymphaea colorata TaxID=210225 RepID=A0A5K1CCL2_9MAGN|nr:amino acid transporter AVT6E-like [Nymphaea colorata]
MYSDLPISSEVRCPTDRSGNLIVPQKPAFADGAHREPNSSQQHGHDDIDVLPLIFNETRSGSGVPGAVFNLATSIIGAGIMALPATMRVLGLLLGFVSIILMGILSEFSIEVLVKFAALKRTTSYGETVEVACGKSVRVISEISIIVYNCGILIVYLIIMGDVLSGSSSHKGVFEQMLGKQGWWDDRRLVIFLLLILVLAPLCSLQKIDSLSSTSAASVALAVVFVVVACVVAFVKLVEGKLEAPRLLPDVGTRRAVLDLLVVIPIMTNAYICHANVQPIYNELEGRSVKKMIKVGRISAVLSVVVYAFTATSGYLLFGKGTDSDVLTNFDRNLGVPHSAVINYIVRISYVIHLLLVFPVIHFSLRNTVDAAIFRSSIPLQECRKKSLLLTFVLLALLYLGSAVIPNIWVAFKFTGTTSGLALGFFFPSLIGLRLNGQGESLSSRQKMLLRLMLVLALVTGIIGVVGNAYSIKEPGK